MVHGSRTAFRRNPVAVYAWVEYDYHQSDFCEYCVEVPRDTAEVSVRLLPSSEWGVEKLAMAPYRHWPDLGYILTRDTCLPTRLAS